jgi:ComF family protein
MPGPLSDVLETLLPSPEPIGDRAALLAEWRVDPPAAYCHRCGATAGPDSATDTGCAHCRDKPVAWHGATRLGAYHEPLRSWLLAMKFGRRWMWCRWFADRLADALPPIDRAVVVPVPLHWRRRWHRGFDQSVLIAGQLARRRGWPMARLLRRVRPTRAQSRLTAQAERQANVRGAFAVRPVDLAGWTIVLVDDIRTSGATAGRCARLLRRQHAARVHLAVVAAADPKHADFTRR